MWDVVLNNTVLSTALSLILAPNQTILEQGLNLDFVVTLQRTFPDNILFTQWILAN